MILMQPIKIKDNFLLKGEGMRSLANHKGSPRRKTLKSLS